MLVMLRKSVASRNFFKIRVLNLNKLIKLCALTRFEVHLMPDVVKELDGS